ncbi:SDR family oxidoreductase, partial [Streptomyces lydicus]|uniref:SDR family oxidoreductase n=1 Tax=Streptomyces lydicus TaxID=47763 RepID=UPI0036FA71D0
MTVLIVGGSGFLGSELVRQARTAGHTTVATYATKPGNTSRVSWCHLDLRDVGRLEAVMAEVDPRVIVNASSGGENWAVTAEGPLQLAILAARHGTRMVHVSTDAVFSGAAVHYDESCLPDPITPYGAAKAASETGVLAVHPKAVVARTSLIIG